MAWTPARLDPGEIRRVATLLDLSFVTDLEAAVAEWPDGYSVGLASELVIERLFVLL